ncbi:MAG: hypothetical protein M1838_001341 [Thelocarpon superellum]|nr:MAG: hypothetical protein M1838_001341 [Thelocarpon superellum]
MVEKRKLSTRARAEPASKKRTPTPPDDPPASESPRGALPTRLENGDSLPTLDAAQSDGLSSKDYQSVADSGVLATALQRSRQKWLTEGIFERYWTKPSKKKGQVDAHNPLKESMVKIGPCTLTIEPHVFEVNLFSVKEPLPPSTVPPNTQGGHRPIIQYGPPNPPLHPNGPHANGISHPPNPPASAAPRSDPPSVTPSARPPSPRMSGAPHAPTNGVSPAQPAPPPASSPAKPNADPVIQMLATKAATDADLKALMKVVASGKASSGELKTFQDHIDELTALLHRREKAAAAPARDAYHPEARPIPTPSSSHPALPVVVHGEERHEPNGQNQAHTPSVKTEPSPLAPAHVGRPKGTVSSAKPEVSDVVFDFCAGSGDRFLFPKYSILQYLPGGSQVIASFLVVRKGSDSADGTYDPALDYYQPVTMRLTAHSAKILEPLSRVVASPVEARRYMDDIMDHMTRAEYVHLAMRLPRDTADGEGEPDEPVPRLEREESVKALYTPPGSIGPPKVKVPKPAPPIPDRSSTEPWASPGPTTESMLGRPRRGRVADPNKTCHLCHTSTTSLWRKADIEGENVTVCNACGIKWKTNYVRTQEAAHGPMPKKVRGQNKAVAATAAAATAASRAAPPQQSPQPPPQRQGQQAPSAAPPPPPPQSATQPLSPSLRAYPGMTSHTMMSASPLREVEMKDST